jgi:hypothetical protein
MPLHHVPTYKIFSAWDAEGRERGFRIQAPKRRGIKMNAPESESAERDFSLPDYSLTLLEKMVLLVAARLVDARRVLEFGTHLGGTTLTLAQNMPAGGKVITLDIVPVDRWKEWHHPDFAAGDVKHHIRAYGEVDTGAWIPPDMWLESFDLIWIDGNPDRTKDTFNAFRLLNPHKLSCIGWHDYGVTEGAGSACPNTTETVESLAEQGYDIYHIEQTKTALYFNRPMAQLLGAE